MKEGIKRSLIKIENWGQVHVFRLLFFNTVLVLLVLLRSAGYFYPFFGISVNFIVFALIVMSIFLLHADSKAIFIMSFVFWMFAFALKILGLDGWAERTAIYTYEALVVGAILLMFEMTKKSVNRLQ